MERDLLEGYWRYYISVEKMLSATSQYIEHVEENELAYSDEFCKIILLSGTEVDSMLKIYSALLGVTNIKGNYNMKQYSKALVNVDGIKDLTLSTYTTVVSNGILTSPFADIDETKPNGNLTWWADYQSIKHDRLKNAKKANLRNAVYIVSAQYLILRNLMDYIDKASGQDYIKMNYYSDYWLPAI